MSPDVSPDRSGAQAAEAAAPQQPLLRIVSGNPTPDEVALVVAETAIGPGLPGLTLVGLAATAVRESRERVRAALRQLGFPLPARNVTEAS
mgnify:CR=1 FL=1